MQILAALDGRARAGTDQRIEIHLAHQGRRSVAHLPQGDLIEIAEAARAGLRQLSFPIPLVTGVLVVVHDRFGGDRRWGIAAGRSVGETVASAILNGLDRYLQGADRGADDR